MSRIFKKLKKYWSKIYNSQKNLTRLTEKQNFGFLGKFHRVEGVKFSIREH